MQNRFTSVSPLQVRDLISESLDASYLAKPDNGDKAQADIPR